jgi:hypothetical protein
MRVRCAADRQGLSFSSAHGDTRFGVYVACTWRPRAAPGPVLLQAYKYLYLYVRSLVLHGKTLKTAIMLMGDARFGVYVACTWRPRAVPGPVLLQAYKYLYVRSLVLGKPCTTLFNLVDCNHVSGCMTCARSSAAQLAAYPQP